MIHQPDILLTKDHEPTLLRLYLLVHLILQLKPCDPLPVSLKYLILNAQVVNQHSLEQRAQLLVAHLLFHGLGFNLAEVHLIQQIVELADQVLEDSHHAEPVKELEGSPDARRPYEPRAVTLPLRESGLPYSWLERVEDDRVQNASKRTADDFTLLHLQKRCRLIGFLVEHAVAQLHESHDCYD